MAENIKNIIERTGLSARTFARKYGIPYRTIQNWIQGYTSGRTPSDYVIHLLDKVVRADVERNRFGNHNVSVTRLAQDTPVWVLDDVKIIKPAEEELDGKKSMRALEIKVYAKQTLYGKVKDLPRNEKVFLSYDEMMDEAFCIVERTFFKE